LLRVLNQAFDQPLKAEEGASAPLAGGLLQNGYQCGMIWGAALAAGAQAHRLYGSGVEAEAAAIHASKRLVETFRARNKHINCLEITELDKSSSATQMLKFFLIKGGVIGCMKMAARYAKIAFSVIDDSLSEEQIDPPASPVSCSALLVRKMGRSDMHTVMAAGLAGGIGLCGGACGALGTAIWIHGLSRPTEESSKAGFKEPALGNMIDRFLKCTDFKFECSEIVGRKFESIHDHADHLRNGGCSKIFETLAGD
jgi:hypothetical protein